MYCRIICFCPRLAENNTPLWIGPDKSFQELAPKNWRISLFIITM
jgi:hypothetical protein